MPLMRAIMIIMTDRQSGIKTSDAHYASGRARVRDHDSSAHNACKSCAATHRVSCCEGAVREQDQEHRQR